MAASGYTLRIIVLGAGFSAPAGLPLGSELFREVRRQLAGQYGSDNRVERDLERYLLYVERCFGYSLDAETVEYEKFLSFLDIEHYLRLTGKDTWSDEGNESQLMVRSAISKTLYERQPDTVPDLYLKFVNSLTTNDTILTFNYDTLLERALEQVGFSYRLFPDRYSQIGVVANTVDSSKDELVYLKLHGSIDWFDRAPFERSTMLSEQAAHPYKVSHPVFGHDQIVAPTPITDGPRAEDDRLRDLYRVHDLEPLLRSNFWQCSPLILSPSHSKIFYAEPLRDFWWVIQRADGLNLGMGVIGYSLPGYDEYARQALYSMFRNYTEYEPDLELDGVKKSNLRILDYRPGGDDVDLRAAYRFVNWARTDIWLDGFNENSLEWLFAT